MRLAWVNSGWCVILKYVPRLSAPLFTWWRGQNLMVLAARQDRVTPWTGGVRRWFTSRPLTPQ